MQKFPEIISFRITSHCNNNCIYCYGPKQIRDLNRSQLYKIFQFLAQNKAETIVITGGEPLLRKDIDQILAELKKLGLKIYLDTNGDYFFKHKSAINKYVDGLGLPLDYASNNLSFRNKDNFWHILEILSYYQSRKRKPSIRVGTVVTKINSDQIEKIAKLLINKCDLWKIYQFIPVGHNASKNAAKLKVNDKLFGKISTDIKNKFGKKINILISKRKARDSAYFMINPDGKVIMPVDYGYDCEEIIIGDVLEKNTIKKWKELVNINKYKKNAELTFNHKFDSQNNKNIILEIRRELKQNIDLEYKKGAIRHFKEPIKVYGVRSKIVRKIAQKYFPLFGRSSQKWNGGKKKFFSLCEQMLRSNYHEEAIIVFIWAEKLVKNFQESDFKIFERWLKKYVNNWAKVDVFCTHTINYFVQNYPEVIPKIKKWASSKNRWMRRAAAVSFVSGSKDFPQKKHLKHIFWIAEKLLKNKDDLVQKGYGWMLKRTAENFEKEVSNFVMQNKSQMPRTALRYAIEKMPASWRRKAMS